MRLSPVLLFALAALPALADGRGLVSLQTGDDQRGWEAVGRLELGTRGFCTATLIADDLVLTAAHCMFDKATGARHDIGDIEFRLGLRNGRAEAYRGVKAAAVHPDYIYAGVDNLDRVAYDLALLQLDQPVRLPQVHPFATGSQPQTGDTVGVVSYAQDRAEVASLEPDCDVLDKGPDILVLSCDVDFGSSGAPVFHIGPDGRAVIVSVISAKAEVKGRKVALGTALDRGLNLLKAELGLDAPGKVRLLSAGGTGGAKFIRP